MESEKKNCQVCKAAETGFKNVYECYGDFLICDSCMGESFITYVRWGIKDVDFVDFIRKFYGF